MPPPILKKYIYFVFERRYSQQKSVICLKSNILVPWSPTPSLEKGDPRRPIRSPALISILVLTHRWLVIKEKSYLPWEPRSQLF